VLVVNAGRQQYREDIADLSAEDFDKTVKTNLYALHWITQAAVPHMPPGASIVTTASTQAYNPSAILLDYAMTKAGIAAYTKALSKQLLDKGIRANVVAPGPFWTALQWSGGQPTDAVTEFGSKTGYERPGQPVEIAPVYVLLASQEGSYINGEVYGVTGGSGIA
jgi:NAD(P)-dependent dehydrogenase (short-subunit alcohol dehydrogenase family)